MKHSETMTRQRTRPHNPELLLSLYSSSTRHTLVSSSLLANEHQGKRERGPPTFTEDAAAISSSPSLPSLLMFISGSTQTLLPLHLKPFILSDFTPLPFQASPHHLPPSVSNPKHIFPPPSILTSPSLSPSPFCLYSRRVSYVTHGDSAASPPPPPFGCCSSDSPLQPCQNCLPTLRSCTDAAVTCTDASTLQLHASMLEAPRFHAGLNVAGMRRAFLLTLQFRTQRECIHGKANKQQCKL